MMYASIALSFVVVVLLFLALRASRAAPEPEGPSFDPDAVAALVEKLEALGIYRQAIPADLSELKMVARETGYIYGGSLSQCDYPMSGEDIVETGVADTMKALRHSLKDRGVQLEWTEEFNFSGPHSVTLNSVRTELYDREEFETGRVWLLAKKRLISALNQCLDAINADERLHLLDWYGLERVVYLTAAMLQTIRDSGLYADACIPCPVD